MIQDWATCVTQPNKWHVTTTGNEVIIVIMISNRRGKNIAEKFNPLNTAHKLYRRQTDDRRTADAISQT